MDKLVKDGPYPLCFRRRHKIEWGFTYKRIRLIAEDRLHLGTDIGIDTMMVYLPDPVGGTLHQAAKLILTFY